MRGYQKRVIYMKNTGSELFDEAYFVLRCDGARHVPNVRMIDEAKKIIKENTEKRRGFLFRHRWNILSFLTGASLAALLFIIF